MFRRNRPLRPLRRAIRNVLGMPFAPAFRRQIFEANQLKQAGQSIQAADSFASLAAQALQNGQPQRAANLNTQAAHAYVDGKNESLALAQSRSALTLFQQLGMTERLSQFWMDIQKHMQQSGMVLALNRLQDEFRDGIHPIPVYIPTSHYIDKPGHLPAQCPGCGAPVRTDEVDWVNENSAACPYCGSVLLSH